MDVKVNIINDFSVGFNTHNFFLPPVDPVPAPMPSIEMIATQLWTYGYVLNQNKLTTTVTHKGMRIVLDGHDCGVMIPDVTIPPVNAYYPLMWPFSSRKIAFSASMEQMNGTAVGCADSMMHPMMTCGNPVTMPTAMVFTSALNSVTVGTTTADEIFGGLGILASIAFDLISFSPGAQVKPAEVFEHLVEDFFHAVLPITDVRRFVYTAVSGLVLSGLRCIATHGEYPVSLNVSPTSPHAGVGGSLSWSHATGFQAQGSANTGADVSGRSASTRQGVQNTGASWGRPLNPPDNNPGWQWSAGGGWTR